MFFIQDDNLLPDINMDDVLPSVLGGGTDDSSLTWLWWYLSSEALRDRAQSSSPRNNQEKAVGPQAPRPTSSTNAQDKQHRPWNKLPVFHNFSQSFKLRVPTQHLTTSVRQSVDDILRYLSGFCIIAPSPFERMICRISNLETHTSVFKNASTKISGPSD